MKQWLSNNQKLLAKVATSAAKGSAAGAIASISTGVAVIATAPAWAPFVGGAILISGTTLAAWGAAGAVVGAVTGGGLQLYKKKSVLDEWDKH